MCISLSSILIFFKYLIASNKLKTAKKFELTKFFGPSIDLSTCVSAAKLKMALGRYFLIILIISFLLPISILNNL